MRSSRATALRNRNFLLLWGGNGLSLMGTFGARICYPILALEISGSPVVAGWTAFAASVPNLLLSAHAGVVADYADRRRTMLRCQLVGATVSAVLTAWILFGGGCLQAVLMAVALLETTASAYFGLAEVAAIRDLVPEEQYAGAFSLYEAEQPAAILIGRVLGAASLGIARWFPFAGNLVSYVISLGSVSAIRGNFSPVVDRSEARRESFGTRAREGLRWVRGSRFLGVSTIATGVANALIQVTILLLIVQSHAAGRPSWVLGIILSGGGVGGLIGAALAPRLIQAFDPNLVFIAGLWSWAAVLSPMALTSNPAATAVSWSAVGAIGTVVAVVNTLSRIEAVPPEALGRVVGLVSVVTDGAVPLGAAAGGYLLAAFGLQATARLLPITLAVLALVSGTVLPRTRSTAKSDSRLAGASCNAGRVGNLYDYFAADDDETAAATLEHAPDPGQFDVLAVKGLDPVLPLATLESLLRGVEYEQVWADPRRCKLLTDPEHESCWVVTITDTLRDALATASAEQLEQAATPWSETDDFRGQGVAESLGDFLLRFAGLARTAQERNRHLYCWISL